MFHALISCFDRKAAIAALQRDDSRKLRRKLTLQARLRGRLRSSVLVSGNSITEVLPKATNKSWIQGNRSENQQLSIWWVHITKFQLDGYYALWSLHRCAREERTRRLVYIVSLFYQLIFPVVVHFQYSIRLYFPLLLTFSRFSRSVIRLRVDLKTHYEDFSLNTGTSYMFSQIAKRSLSDFNLASRR